MISRSSSTAGDRLRRAKSTSSADTSSSGVRRIAQSSDPVSTRRQAEIAAAEAYYRALPHQELKYEGYRPVPPKPQRRRSRVSGLTEGGHFEDARLGRRKSTSRKDDATDAKAKIQCLHQSNLTSEINGEERIVTRKRSVILPDPRNDGIQHEHAMPITSRPARKSHTGYTDGSPVPRSTGALKERRSTLILGTPRANHVNSEKSGQSDAPYSYTSDDIPIETHSTQQRSDRKTKTDEEIIAHARDQCLQDFRTKKLPERKSFILAPFQRRRATNVMRSSESGYDTSLPPFNFADEDSLPAPPPCLPQPEYSIPVTILEPERKGRKFSESLKGRFKKVFRNASRVPSGLPAQHVEGRHFQFSAESPLSTPTITQEVQDDPFTVSCESPLKAAPASKHDSGSSSQNIGVASTTKSRVTSWTNSTVAGTWSTRPDDEELGSVDEHGRLNRSDNVSTLRRATSFLGRATKSKLCRPSKAALRSSEDSIGLYSALKQRIDPSESEKQSSESELTGQSETSSAIATLPSQQKSLSSVTSKSRYVAPTIRTVTPDPTAYKLGIPSPVTEVLSPDLAAQHPNDFMKKEDEHSDTTPKGQLQRRLAMKAPAPSKEQLARRIERSKNRWQSPLDELSPPAPRTTGHARAEDNPYELRSLSRTLQQPLARSDLPHHARIGAPPTVPRENVLSPSLYSRATDGASPRPETPIDHGGMMVTITGREVRSYSISPKKHDVPAERPVYGSGEWRQWMSNEMSGLAESPVPEELSLPEQLLADVTPIRVNPSGENEQDQIDAPKGKTESASPSLNTVRTETKIQRPLVRHSRSSFMNERFPMIDTGRNSLDKSVKDGRRISSRAESRLSIVEPTSQDPSVDSRATSAASERPVSVISRQRVVSKHPSTVHLESATTTKLALVGKHAVQEAANVDVSASDPIIASSAQPAGNVRPSYKPKSAFDLRANYKISTTGKTKPLNVRRKTEAVENIHILEDTTIQNISAGPYASEPIIHAAADTNKENSPPAEAKGIPSLSSSEWLAAGTSKKRDSRKPSAVHPACRNRNVSRYSPSGTGAESAQGGGGSPGQRLASSWLDGRKSKENSPALI